MALDQEILVDFCTESKGLLKELEGVVEALEDAGDVFPTDALKEFSQKIDRIMGAAKTLLAMDPKHQGIAFVSNVAEMCKTMGYQAAALQQSALVPIFAGFWAETLEVMAGVLETLESEESTKAFVEERSPVLQKRLRWLAEKVAPSSEQEKEKVVALLRKL